MSDRHFDAVVDTFPLSSSQQAMWMIHKLFPDSPIYNNHFVWDIPATLDIDRLRQALEQLIVRHPVLRTTYGIDTQGTLCQHVHAGVPLQLSTVSAPELDDAEFQKRIDRELYRPFILEKSPPIRWIHFVRKDGAATLMLLYHHITIDLWGHMVLMNDLERIYSIISAEVTASAAAATLPPPVRTFKQFVLEQSDFLASGEGIRQAEFWRQQLCDMPGHLEIPTTHSRPALRTFRQKNYHFDVPKLDLQKFHASLSTVPCSLFAQFETLFHAFLHRYSQQADIFIGTPTAGRDESYSGVFGYFNNSIVIRNTVDPDESFLDFLRRHNTVIDSSLGAQDYPFSLLTHFLADHSDPSRALIVQFFFVWENINRFENRHNPKVTLSDERREIWNLGDMGIWKRQARVQQLDDMDLTLKIQKYGDSYNFCFAYNSDLFSVETMARTAEHFVTFLRSVTDAPNRPIAQLNMLGASEYQTLIHDWNNTAVAYDRNRLLPSYLSQLSQRQPDATAIDASGKTISYSHLENTTNQVAHFLLSKGITKGAVVGVYLDRTPALLYCMLGIMKAGAVYLPLDPHYPSERLHYIVQDAAPAFLFCHRHQAAEIDIQPDKTQILHWEDAALQHAPHHAPTVQLLASDTAYIIYTSGSTGRPKGVAVTHANVCHLMCALKVFQLTANDRLLQFASINFDASIFEIVAALQAGATLVMSQKSEQLGPNLLQLLTTRRVSWAVLPPVLLGQLDPSALPELHTLIVAGDVCPLNMAQKWLVGRRFFNAYGPTETTIWATLSEFKNGTPLSIGTPIANTRIYILDQQLNPQPIGHTGEIYVGGDGVSKGYLHRPDLTAEKFIADPFVSQGLLYKTGDLARYRESGDIEFLGRVDDQLKIRGHRIESGEIESILREHPNVREALVTSRDDDSANEQGNKLLVAYLVPANNTSIDAQHVRQHVRAKLPDYMVPAYFICLNAFPLTSNQKIDRRALPAPTSQFNQQDPQHKGARTESPRTELERIIANTWAECLGLNSPASIGINENFFDVGGHSLLLAKVHKHLPEYIQSKVTLIDLYKYPTIQSLARAIENHACKDPIFVKEDRHEVKLLLRRQLMANLGGVKIAIVGMAGRFPGADTVAEFWKNLCDGTESITFFSDQALLYAGVPADTLKSSNYVRAKGKLNSVEDFDAEFFNYSPREAKITDPQQRLFLECAWEALEDAGCVPTRYRGKIGVFGGMGINQYFRQHLCAHPELLASVGDYAVNLGNDKDFLCSRVAYKLNLDGPAVVVQTACSTSLVAVHTACQALLNRECDAALAGGVSLGDLENHGYSHQEGMILSADGHCRAFDADASGTVQGQGCGIVLLKRLDDALKNNDQIYAVISGSATNNDGAHKSGYTAPSIEGQAKAIRLAQASALLEPHDITYIETHGTGTPVGDPIEIEALKQVFHEQPIKHCAIGSVKTNLGHLDVAAGITGLIKTALIVKNNVMPASLHFRTPNPRIGFDTTPFYVNTQLRPWRTADEIRHAGVSSFGMGGTNAHVILSQAPVEAAASASRPWQLVTLSARTTSALEQMTERFVNHLLQHPEQDFANICFTLHTGRTLFKHRRHLVCKNREDAIAELRPLNPKRVLSHEASDLPRKLVFLFPGQGSQYVGMGEALYQTETAFRDTIDHCNATLKQKFPTIFETLTYSDAIASTEKIHQTSMTQPCLFIFEYALAKMLMSWGITPDYMLGHSVGEYVAACLAGVFTLDQALELVTIRGQLTQQLESGQMLAVTLSEAEALAFTSENISLAAINGEKRCVLSGDHAAIQHLHERLNQQGIENRILNTSHAFHSHMLDPICERFAAHVQRLAPQRPTLRFISTLTGEWITHEQATSSQYWVNHLRYTVRFHHAVHSVFQHRAIHQAPSTALTFLEVGPSQVLSALARQHPEKAQHDTIISCTRNANDPSPDPQYLLKALGRLWEEGVDIDWDKYHSDRQHHHVSLPTYPFERRSYWVAAAKAKVVDAIFSIDSNSDDHVSPGNPVEQPSTGQRTPLENAVWQAWANALGRSDFDVHDNFFDLGGDSMIAITLLDQLRRQFRVTLNTAVLIQHATVTDLASYIGAQTNVTETCDKEAIDKGTSEKTQQTTIVPPSPLVMIQRGVPQKTPLVLIHPIGGDVLFYRNLAQQLGSDMPVHAIQAPSLFGAEPPSNSIYSLAERYINELKRAGLQPPFLLGGCSFGGLVAYEMAQQLQILKQEIRLVALIDTTAPQDMPPAFSNATDILHYLLRDHLVLDLEHMRTLEAQTQIDYVLQQAQRQGKSQAIPVHLGVPLFNTWLAHQRAAQNYILKPGPHNVVYFEHTDPMLNFPEDPHKSWLPVVKGNFTLHRIRGNHISMNFPPYVNSMASHLKTEMERTFPPI